MSSKVFKPFLVLAVFILLVGLACNAGGSATPEPQPPVEPVAAEEVKPVEPQATEEPAATEEAKPASDAINDVKDVEQAVIQIESQGTFIDPEFGLVLNGAGRGSGFIIDPSGLAVTNNHVVTGAALLKVWVGGESEARNAKVLGVSECSDLAVIDIDGDGFPYLEWFDGEISVGQDIFVAGFPLGDPEYTLTKGVISKERADGETSWSSVDSVLEYDATTNPGNSGGPVVTEDGKVIAVHYMGSGSTRQAFGISRDVAMDVIDVLKGGKNVDTIGVNGQAVATEDGSIVGVWVSSVQSGSPAANAGVQPADVITMLEDLVLATDGSMADYCDILRSHEPGDTLSVTAIRWPTGEVLEGELNGNEMEVVGMLDGGSSSSGDTSGGTTDASGDTVNLTPSGSGDFFYYTEFDGTLDNWEYFLMNGEDDDFYAEAADSNLHVEINNTNTWVYFLNTTMTVTDVRLDTLSSNLGRNNNNVSLICRYSDEGWYEINIWNSGKYDIFYYDSLVADDYKQLFSGGSTAIKTGKDINEYTVTCIGDELSLYVNGQHVRTVKDKNLKEGQFGVGVSSFDVTPIIVELDFYSASVP
ncbi:MAG: S1C family serine protease [Chloroflexi bacterium]|nr:S1C family serine protease [Chloroflexota bacterium]